MYAVLSKRLHCLTGSDVIKALENGVSMVPKLEGRFPQVAGINFTFDPSKPAGERVEPELIRIQDEYLQLEKVDIHFCYWFDCKF